MRRVTYLVYMRVDLCAVEFELQCACKQEAPRWVEQPSVPAGNHRRIFKTVSSFLETRAFFHTPLTVSVQARVLGKGLSLWERLETSLHTFTILRYLRSKHKPTSSSNSIAMETRKISSMRTVRLVDGLRRWKIAFWLPVPSQV